MLNLIALFVLVPVIACVLVVLNLLLAPYRPTASKQGTYECGLLARTGQARQPFSVLFYLVAVLFLAFDLEVTLLWPLTVVLGLTGLYGFWVATVFFGILTLGFVVELASGVLRFS